ncbi:hypothetical protein [Actinoplanes sp. RD1]|uniref:hypothetical protein n=1 Tax=Actinoplanes sp. RD1 TaxID=3064538 RepID=UPI0027407329|nr:hypothetical protein [Actinoplanes sp. RD1]
MKNFLYHLDIWVAAEKPPDDLRLLVTTWIMSRSEDPYLNARREPGFPNLWYLPIPDSYHDGAVVGCSFEIYEQSHEVICRGFGTLSWPA